MASRHEGVMVASARSPKRFHDEAFGLLSGGLSLFLLLSLLSWSHTHAGGTWTAPAANWGGILGQWLASRLFLWLGGGAFLVVGLLGHAAYVWCCHARRPQ